MLSQHFTHTIEIVGVITHRAHALVLTGFEDILRDHLALHFNTLNLSAFVLESAMHFHEFWITLHTISIAISLPVVMGPAMGVAGVPECAVVVGPPAVKECIFHLRLWHLVLPNIVWMRKMPIAKTLALAIIVVGIITYRLHALLLTSCYNSLTVYVSFHLHAVKYVALPVEILSFAIRFDTERVTIFAVSVGPCVAISSVLQRPLVVCSATIKICTLC